MAGCNACSRKSAGGRPSCRAGSPTGIAPMTGASVNHNTPSAVPAASATRGPGAKRENRRGQRNPTASVTAPMAKAPTSMAFTAAGSARTAPIGPPCRSRRTEQRQCLHQQDDDANTGHEAGYHHVRRVGHETANPRYAQKHLQQARQDHDRQRLAEAVRMAGQDDRHGDAHRRSRTGYLRARAAEHRCEETDRDGAIEPGCRAHPRGDAEAEGNGQRHHHRGDAAEDIAAQSVEVVVQAEPIHPSRAPPVIPGTGIIHDRGRVRQAAARAGSCADSRHSPLKTYWAPRQQQDRAAWGQPSPDGRADRRR